MKKRLEVNKKSLPPSFSEAQVSKKIESFLAISHCITHGRTPDECLTEIVGIAKKELALDQFVLYERKSTGLLEPMFARSDQKKPSNETDLSWGDTLARKTIDGGIAIQRQETYSKKDGVTRRPYQSR